MKLKAILALTGLMTFAASSQAALMNFTGAIQNHNDVVYTYFTVADDATDVSVWTDSFMSGTNFDPITALWTADGNLLAQNDDNASINPSTQTYYDSGFNLANLAAGDYIFTVATYANFAAGNTLNDGFAYDGQAAIALEDWTQPANDIDMGPFWSVWLDGVDSATNPHSVPEPSSLILLLLGAMGLGVARRKAA